MNVVLVIVALCLISFTVAMIHTFNTYGMIPDTLCTCVFSVLGGECGVMGWIRTTKDRHKERQWELEDKKSQKEENR